ncbi:MAG TPA: DUF1697 domain-containing protein [Steroidobacteraceae bacterium]
MKTWIVLFRGINVGGKNMLPMKLLTALLEEAGCRDVRTYIQSGNVVLRSPLSDASRVATRIRMAVSDSRGFEPRVLVLNRAELQKAMAANPYREATAHPKSVHLFFLAERPTHPDIESLNGIKAKSESFTLDGRILYLHTPEGFGTSKLAERAERCLDVAATARNWRTCSALLELAASYE